MIALRTVKTGAQGNVFFVERPAALPRQSGAGQPHQAAKIAIPELLDITGVARLKSLDPERNRMVIRHAGALPLLRDDHLQPT
jgi:hypothetical protein